MYLLREWKHLFTQRHTQIFRADIFLVVKNWKQKTWKSIHWWVDKEIGYTYMMNNSKGTNYWYMQHHGWISKTLCQVIKPSQKPTCCMNFIYNRTFENVKLEEWKSDQWLPGICGGTGDWLQKGIRKYSGVMEMFLSWWWWWLHDWRYLSKLIKLCTLGGWILPSPNYTATNWTHKM